MEKVELVASLAGSRTPVSFPPDGGAKLALDIPESDEDAAYMLKKHFLKKALKVTFEVLDNPPDTRETAGC